MTEYCRYFLLLIVLLLFSTELAKAQHVSDIDFDQITSIRALDQDRFIITQAISGNSILIFNARTDTIERSFGVDKEETKKTEARTPQPAPQQNRPPPGFAYHDVSTQNKGVNYAFYEPDNRRIIVFSADQRVLELTESGEIRREISHPSLTVHYVQQMGRKLWVSGSMFLQPFMVLRNQQVPVGFVLDLDEFTIDRVLQMSPTDFGVKTDPSLRATRGFYFQPYVIPVHSSAYLLTSAGSSSFVLHAAASAPRVYESLRPGAIFQASVSAQHGAGVRTEAVNLGVSFYEGKWWFSSGNRYQGIPPMWSVISIKDRNAPRPELEIAHQEMPVSEDSVSSSMVCAPGPTFTLCYDYFASQASYVIRYRTEELY
ncbi:MAG: hypothetical protein LAT67_01300 [Balneolales bacterium]|nr:hypothetical protein [Balneolales bacterium]